MYYNESTNRTHEISELLKSKFNFKFVNAEHPSPEGMRTIEVSYDARCWKVLKIHADSPNHEIIEFIQHSLMNNRWDDSYELNPHSMLIGKIIDEYALQDIGFYQIKNTLYCKSDDAKSLDEVTGTYGLKSLHITFDNYDDLETLTLNTQEGMFALSENGCSFTPNEHHEQDKAWGEAFDEAFEKHYNTNYEAAFHAEHKRLMEAGYEEDEANKAAHRKAHNVATRIAGEKATDAANAVVDGQMK